MADPPTGRESLAQSRQIDSLECQAGTGKPNMSATRPPPRSSGRPRQHAKVRRRLSATFRRSSTVHDMLNRRQTQRHRLLNA